MPVAVDVFASGHHRGLAHRGDHTARAVALVEGHIYFHGEGAVVEQREGRQGVLRPPQCGSPSRGLGREGGRHRGQARGGGGCFPQGQLTDDRPPTPPVLRGFFVLRRRGDDTGAPGPSRLERRRVRVWYGSGRGRGRRIRLLSARRDDFRCVCRRRGGGSWHHVQHHIQRRAALRHEVAVERGLRRRLEVDRCRPRRPARGRLRPPTAPPAAWWLGRRAHGRNGLSERRHEPASERVAGIRSHRARHRINVRFGRLPRLVVLVAGADGPRRVGV